MKAKEIISKNWLSFTLMRMSQDYQMGSNAENVQNKQQNAVRNAKVFGIVAENAKYQTGQITNLHATREFNN